jgi:hypothetical protein
VASARFTPDWLTGALDRLKALAALAARWSE